MNHSRCFPFLSAVDLTFRVEPVNDLARGFGGDGFCAQSPLQRYFRDINMLAVHALLDIAPRRDQRPFDTGPERR